MCQAALEQHLAEKAVEMRILQEQNDWLRAQASSLQQQLSSLQMAQSMQDVGHMHGQHHPVLSTMMCARMSIYCQLAVLSWFGYRVLTACCFMYGYKVTQTLLLHEQNVHAL